MDTETPVDAWYCWLGVALVSVAVGGVALALPGTPPPDANRLANTVDRVAGSPADADAVRDHDADAFRLRGNRIALRNDGGTTRATAAFGTLTLARGDERLRAVLRGQSVEAAFGDRRAFLSAAGDARKATNESVWREARGRLRVRTLVWGDRRVTLVDL
jgi:hypothetical protein